jgi:hypothetical protein
MFHHCISDLQCNTVAITYKEKGFIYYSFEFQYSSVFISQYFPIAPPWEPSL